MRKQLSDRWRVAKNIAVRMRPAGVAAAVLAVAWTLLGTWRDEVPSKLQPPLLWDALEWLPPLSWLTITLLLALVLMFEAAYHEILSLEHVITPAKAPTQAIVAEKGLLDFIPDGIQAMADLTNHLKAVAKSTAAIGPKLQRHTKRIQQVADDPQRRRNRAADAARDMNEHAAILEANAPPMRICASTFGKSYASYFEAVDDAALAADRAKIMQFRAQITQMINNAKASREQGVQSYRDSVLGLRKRNLSQALNQASDRLVAALDEQISIMQEIESASRNMLRRIDARLVPKKPAPRKPRKR